ncbi:FAR1-related protein [Striga asiatica]|uniref:FAR1-related protein n=1 Tax=Striga asiatica TaxID=4170 RepID=A0A5A7PWP4_STRAF|nr:FAR1-related protein [Striga asiatica]
MYKQFLNVSRNMDIGHQKFLLNCSRVNIGPTKCYRLFKETVRRYSNVGCTSVDFKNFSRDLKAFVVGVDAQIVIEKLYRKKELCSALFIDYAVDGNDQLTRLFWTDPISRKNYASSVMLYNMIFAPFTGKDNHVPDKVPSHLKKDDGFRKKLNNIVWSESIGPSEFEAQWNDLIDEDFMMSGLFKTTSMSESENSFFGRYTSPHSNLLEFFMHFESALDAQRHAQEKMNSVDEIILTLVDDPDHRFYEIEDVTYGACEVVYDKSQNTATCSCKKFVRVGLLCCHVFYMFKDLNLQSIPEKYLVPRWTKYASLKPIFEVHGQIIDQCAMIEERKSIMNQLFSEFYSCIGLVEGNNDFMTSLLHSLKNQRHIFTSGLDQPSATTSKKKLFEDYYGGSIPQKVQVLPPFPVKMKGSGSRLKSRKEKAIEKSNKPLRRCTLIYF